MNETYDVIVVLVLERETAFRDRVRGELLAPWGVQEVEALGLRDVVESVPHANLITRHVGYDETLSAGEAEARAFDFAGIVPSGGCIGVGHHQLQELLLAQATRDGATVLRGVRSARVAPGDAHSVDFVLDGDERTATCRLVVAADGREPGIRKSLGIELHATDRRVIMAGMLVDGAWDWPSDQQATGVEGDLHYLVFP